MLVCDCRIYRNVGAGITMILTYTQNNSYQISCDVNGLVTSSNVITNTNIYGDKVLMTSTANNTQIPFAKMQAIVDQLKAAPL